MNFMRTQMFRFRSRRGTYWRQGRYWCRCMSKYSISYFINTLKIACTFARRQIYKCTLNMITKNGYVILNFICLKLFQQFTSTFFSSKSEQYRHVLWFIFVYGLGVVLVTVKLYFFFLIAGWDKGA